MQSVCDIQPISQTLINLEISPVSSYTKLINIRIHQNPSKCNWHERAAFQRAAFGWSTAGNQVVATFFISLFFFFHTFPDPVDHFGAPGGFFGVCGDERVPPSPLCWYRICCCFIIVLIADNYLYCCT